jgi:hypothetical protein
MHIHPFLIAQLLVLLALANGAPLIAKRLFGSALAFPLDNGITLEDGQPLFGADIGLPSHGQIGREVFMRTYALAIAVMALFAFPASAFSQGIQVPGIEIGPGGVGIGDDDRREGASRRECEELRRACLHKEELGEEGQGNCRRYREICKE